MSESTSTFEKIIKWIPENNRLERIWLMAKFDFVTRYYGSFLGLFWALLKPLFELMIYYFVFTFIFNNKTEKFLLFIFLGIILFQWFSESTSKAMNIFIVKRYLLENIQINKMDMFYSGIAATFMGFVFNFLAFIIGSILLVDSYSVSILFFPVILFNLFLFILASKLIFATISIYLKDIDNIWFVVSTMLFWGSGIFFNFNAMLEAKTAFVIQTVNPLAGILTNARNVLIYAKPVDMTLLISNLLVSVLFLTIGLWVFKNYSAKALEKI